MKICVVTYYGNNYGGQLQAFATQKYLESIGYNNEILKYTYFKKSSKIVLVVKKINNVFKMGIKNYINARKIMRKNFANDRIRDNRCEEFIQNNLVFTKLEYNNENIEKINNEFDCFISGSDQIWNPSLYNSCNYVYYLGFVNPDKKKISYASSIGVRDLDNKYINEFAKYVGAFDSVSTREIEGKKIVEKYSNKKATYVIDPTALMDKQTWLSFLPNFDRKLGDYILCYFFNDYPYIAEVKKYFKDRFNLKIVSLPFSSREKGSEDIKIYDADPLDFVDLISKAKLVLTDSFHATIFSINLNIPFFCFKRQIDENKKNMNSRIYSLLNKFELQNRLLSKENYKDIKNYECDFSNSNLVLEDFRNLSKKYLKTALEQ